MSHTHEPSNTEAGNIAARLETLFNHLESGLWERGMALRYCMLSAIAGESVFLLGPPGVAKSLLARRLQHAFLDATCFDYLMGRFSTPEEIFGPISISRLKNEDLYVRQTESYLPEADIVFLDEIWKASPPIQNALLTALNEKIFRNGQDEIHLPLKLLIGASNETANDNSSQAFWDRFLVRLCLEPLAKRSAFTAMITDTSDPYQDTVPTESKISRETWTQWQSMVSQVIIPQPIAEMIAELRENLHKQHATASGPFISDRRWKKAVGLLRAAAFCHGRTTVEAVDCFVLEHCLWDKPEEAQQIQNEVRTTIRARAYCEFQQLDSLQTGLTALQNAFRSISDATSDQEIVEPVLADEEYYVLAQIPAGLAERRDCTEVRIWKLDFESLPPANSAGISTDLFLYRHGDYLSSIQRNCSRTSGWEFKVEDQAVGLVCQTRLVSRTVRRQISPAEWAGWDIQLAEYLKNCRQAATEAISFMHARRDEANHHFFAPVGAADDLLVAHQEYLKSLAELEIAAQGCQDTHGAC